MEQFQSYEEVLDFLYGSLPMFQRQGAAAFNKDLGKTLRLLSRLDDPQHAFKSVHVGGTNGKGTTCHMLASIAQEAGYKVGLYTSPHLKSFTERIRLDGQEIPEEFVLQFVNRLYQDIKEIEPSFFEITVAMAFDYFRAEEVDIAVIEVGMGGKLDSTNVITPELSIITNIGWDHTQFLGDTLEKIAGEKAGIIKEGVPVVIGAHQKETDHVFLEEATNRKSTLRFSTTWQVVSNADGSWNIQDEQGSGYDVGTDLYGDYYGLNIPIVLEATEVLKKKFPKIDSASIKRGLDNLIGNTGLKGRWQILGTEPRVICDTGHNLDGVRMIVEQLNEMVKKKLWMIWGTVADKDIRSILQLLPKDANYLFCSPSVPRALEAEKLAKEAQKAGIFGKVITDVNEALEYARTQASSKDLIFVGGSTFLVADLKEL